MRGNTQRIFAAVLLLGGSVAIAGPEVSRHVRLNFVVENPGAVAATGQRVWIYAPVETTATQKLLSLKANVPHRTLHDELNNTILEFAFDDLPPYSMKILTVSAIVELKEEPGRAELPAANFYLRPEPFVESDNPEILKIATQLRRNDDRETVEAIYDWVRSNLRYSGYLLKDHGALSAVQKRQGDCSEYAYLTAALARANKIPARVVGGYFLSQDSIVQGRDHHNWTEVYLDGAWRLLDAQKENLFTNAQRYIAFRLISSRVQNELGDRHRFRASDGVVVRQN